MNLHSLMVVVLWSLLQVTPVWTRCPFLCTCNNNAATCHGIGSLTGFPLPGTITEILINAASLPTIYNDTFSTQTTSILFENSHIGEIQAYAFSNLNKLKRLSFKSCYIREIMSCAFSHLQSNLDIIISLSKIKTIKESGFRNITNMNKLSISTSAFTNLAPFAFQSIRARDLTFSDVDFEQVSTAAFFKLHDIESFTLTRVSFMSLAAGAFYGIRDVRKVHIADMSHFRALQHRTLTDLRQATLEGGGSFRFENSKVDCNCESAPVLEYFQSLSETVVDSVYCANPDRPLLEVSPQEACPGYRSRQEYCSNPSLTMPTCANPSTSSVQKITLNLCPMEISEKSSTPKESTVTNSKGSYGNNRSDVVKPVFSVYVVVVFCVIRCATFLA